MKWKDRCKKRDFYGGKKAVNEGDEQELSEDYWVF